MRKVLSLFIFLMLLAGVVWYFVGVKAGATPKVTKLVKSVTTKVQDQIPLQIQKASITPKRLIIPKLGIDAAVESVGQDSQGRMDIPTNDIDVGWYNMGYKPGDNGSAVIDGHFDTRTGAPAVFYNINKLAPGDEIQVTDADGTKLTFSVTNATSYAFDQVPLKAIFATAGKPTLNLITCDGTWDKNNHNYSQRLVVYSQLKQ